MTARVGLLFGDQALIETAHTAGGEPERVPVDRLVADTGIPREQPPGVELRWGMPGILVDVVLGEWMPDVVSVDLMRFSCFGLIPRLGHQPMTGSP
ncbi:MULTISPECIES: hypothetical protein [unclassified Streptomyces]|uniref:hypothetical protein n=1 Tax=unclassified Streptomyces TaxID=2593676 RepID=UPI003D923D7A